MRTATLTEKENSKMGGNVQREKRKRWKKIQSKSKSKSKYTNPTSQDKKRKLILYQIIPEI